MDGDLAFEDLRMEAIYEFELTDFPATVAVDSKGRSIHRFVEIGQDIE
jgi:fumarate hydratase class I